MCRGEVCGAAWWNSLYDRPHSQRTLQPLHLHAAGGESSDVELRIDKPNGAAGLVFPNLWPRLVTVISFVHVQDSQNIIVLGAHFVSLNFLENTDFDIARVNALLCT